MAATITPNRTGTEQTMKKSLTHRKTAIDDLPAILGLLIDDALGQAREEVSTIPHQCYIEAFKDIDADPNQYLMVVEQGEEIVGTCHLTILPSLTFKGSRRLHIEAVRVSSQHRRKKIGQWMIQAALDYGRSRGASLAQLTTDKRRKDAQKFYTSLGFTPSHEGMKLILEDPL